MILNSILISLLVWSLLEQPALSQVIIFAFLTVLLLMLGFSNARSSTYSRYLVLKILRAEGDNKIRAINELLQAHLAFFANRSGARQGSVGQYIKFARFVSGIKSAATILMLSTYSFSLGSLVLAVLTQDVLFTILFLISLFVTVFIIIASIIIIPYANDMRDSSLPLLVDMEDIRTMSYEESDNDSDKVNDGSN